MFSQSATVRPPVVRLVGDVDHRDFRDVIRVLNADAQLAVNACSPELAIVAQSRPGQISDHEVQRLLHEAPLAGIVGLLGTWCEGETRTGRPWPGVPRIYWYDFTAWWRRQLVLRAAGRCPDWARPNDFGLQQREGTQYCGLHPASSIQHPTSRSMIVIHTDHRDSAEPLVDLFQHYGYATIWQRPGRGTCAIRGAAAGIWEGGQLDESEAVDLARFCRTLATDTVPVIAMLDFPRRHSVDRALETGAVAVQGKPWQNDALIAQVQSIARFADAARAA
jgi:hypothetical protein